MRFFDLFRIAYRELGRNSLRTIFTILGIVVGIAAVIIVVSLGGGAQKAIIDELSGFSSQTILVGAGKEPKGPSDIFQLLTNTLKEPELKALSDSNRVPNVDIITPAIFQVETAEYKGETERGTMLGANEGIFEIFQTAPAEGRTFSKPEVDNRASVVVIGANIREELFGPSDAVGEYIKINDRLFEVIGVLPPIGNILIFNADEFLTIPYTTVQDYVLGAKNYHRIILHAETVEIVPTVVRDIETTLRELHNISDPSRDDFFVDTQDDAVLRVGTITSIFNSVFLAIASISLLVGGIGIMNIMLVSVTERTREIGILKAIGATHKDILSQFLLEAILITLAGGIMGISVGGLLSYLGVQAFNKIAGQNLDFFFSLQAVLAGITISIITGIIFGLYPAFKASKKDPIEALRYE